MRPRGSVTRRAPHISTRRRSTPYSTSPAIEPGPQSLAPSGLTGREVEVLGLVARGGSTEEIARRLSISTKTVRNHLEHIYAKAEVTNRTGAALFAVEHGLVNRRRRWGNRPMT